ncbi:winged helix-turn-helix domain-containing protein [Acidimicrobiia bacterium EGI L10123]|uniref:ATP-binding protein n=1 Tax=Salinilacustrithrix flava TaxID=2957203 RepID=UPI003D7C2862|nr:winged helix-turn-helix domain-containing protein [Acidimicrobiia bacterium EGI L10123]
MVEPQPALRIAVLGPCVVEHDGRDITPASPLQRRLLTLLALRSPRPASIESLMDVAWPHTERPKDPRQNLHTHVSRLRRHLDRGSDRTAAIATDADAYCLDPTVATTDLHELARLTGAESVGEPATTSERLGRALALWRGPSLLDIADSDCGVGEAARLDELRLSLTETRFEQLLVDQADLGLMAELEAFTMAHPYRERPHAVLMESLYHLGRQADALSTYQRLRSRLGEDLGLEPSTALRQLEAKILAHELQDRQLAPTLAVGAREAAPPEPMSGPPRALTALLGREAELAQLRAGVRRSRITTIVGPAGVGKTRLAMALAHELDGAADLHQPLVWCDLTTASSASDAVDVIALALQARRQGSQTTRQAVVTAITGIEPLLFLDNCEQVAEPVADLVVDVLATAPASVVVTARAPLDVAGEELVKLAPMRWADPTISSEPPPAIALFCQRAAAAGADIAADQRSRRLIVDVCRAVDGLPLGIEIAAAQLRNMTLEELAERVTARSGALDVNRRSGAPRHRSIRSALNWSLDSLDVADREVFAAISTFSGSFDALGAAAVLDAADAAEVEDRLRSLSDLSLLTVEVASGRSRFRLLRTARRIGQERAVADGSAPMFLDRHRRWVLELVRDAEPRFRGPHEAIAVRAIEVETDNIRSVLRRAVAQGDADTALTVATSLCDFALHRLRDDVGEWAELALAIEGANDHPLRAAAMATMALVATNRGDLAAARALAAGALEMGQGDTAATLHAHHAQALVALYSGELPEAAAAAEGYLALASSADEPFHGQIACMISGLAELYGGATDRALAWAERSRVLAQHSGAPTSEAWADYLLGEATARRDPARSAALLRSAIAAGETVDNHLVTGVARLSLTTLPIEVGHEEATLEAYRQLIESWRSRNDWTHQWTTLHNLAPLLAKCGADAEAAELLGALTAAEDAPRLFGEAADEIEALRTELSARLGVERVELLRSSGAALSPRDTVDLALLTIEGLLAAPDRAMA